MTKAQQSKLVPLKDIAEQVGITERQARKVLRSEAAHKEQHQYFWLFTKSEAKDIIRKLKGIKKSTK